MDMASKYMQKHDARGEVERHRFSAPRLSNSAAPPRKYYDYHANISASQEASNLSREEAQWARRSAQCIPSAEAAPGRLPRVPTAMRGYADSPHRAVPRALPVGRSAQALHEQVSTSRAGHQHSHSFDYYKTVNSRAIAPASSLSTKFTQASSARCSGPHLRQPPQIPPAYRQSPTHLSQGLNKLSLALECSVCGPGAAGPWRRGPIGPYTLCGICASIEWKDEDAAFPLTIHEALSLLDNMRLIRLDGLSRNASSEAGEDLAQRLQQGLPESTYARAEAFFSRQTKSMTQSTSADIAVTPQPFRNAKLAVQPPPGGDTPIGSQKRERPIDGHKTPAEADQMPTKVPLGKTQPGHAICQRQDGMDRKLLTVQDEIAGLSPQSIAVAALIGQRLPAQTAPMRSMLTPSKAETTLASNRDRPDEGGAVRSSRSKTDSNDLRGEASSGPSGEAPKPHAVDRKRLRFARPFPFRQKHQLQEIEHSRIIDRRRARNEEMRRKYMQKRLEQQGAREAKLIEPELADHVKQASTSAPAVIHSAETPSSSSSQASASLTRYRGPASLRGLLNDPSSP